jgi:nitrogen fixation NifU-like protein
MYSEKVMEHFRNPRNMGEIADADGVGTVGNPICGDMMTIYIKVKDNRIEDVKFKTFGCGAAIATSSMITELAKGKTLEESMKITRADVAENLGGLPPIKMHCSNLAADGLHEAISNYLKKKEESENEIH